jgi:RimJ/RimL family protein N-acetyltransferase
LISVDKTLVGYLRWQPVSRSALDAVGIYEIPDDAIDIDILIGDPEKVGMGIGSCALELLVNLLRAHPSVRWVGMSTSIDNIAAIRAYEKASLVSSSMWILRWGLVG